MSFLIDFLTARAARDNPAFAHQQLQLQERKYALEQAMQLARLANSIVGTPAQRVPTPLLNAGQMEGGVGLMGAPDLSSIQRSLLEQNRQMMQTAHPTLIQAALENMAEYQKSLMDANKDISVNKFKGTDLPFEQYQNMPEAERKLFDMYKGHNTPGVQINMGDNKPIPASEATQIVTPEGYPANIPAGATYADIKDKGYKFGKQPENTEAESMSDLRLARSLVDRVQNAYVKGARVTGFKGAAQEVASGGGLAGAAVSTAMKATGFNPKPEDIQLSSLVNALRNRTMKAMSGLALSAGEAERIKGELPVHGQDDETFQNNIALTMENLSYLDEERSKQRGRQSETSKPESQNSSLPPGWKLLPDGRAQDPSGKIWRRKQ